MKEYLLPLLLVSGAVTAAELKPVPFHKVKMNDAMWQPKVRQMVTDTMPHALNNTQKAVTRLRQTAEYMKNGGGKKPFPHRFISSDLFKVIEGAAMMIQSEKRPELEQRMDDIIEVIGRAQQDDGYLYASHQTGSIGREMGDKPYSYVFHSHELYNVGHLYEAAVAYYYATGKDSLLKIAEKNAKHVNRVFFEGDPNYNGGKPINQAPGHQEIEIGLIKLYRATGNKLYMDMCKKFLDIRGVTFVPRGRRTNSATYAQQHKPVAEQEKAVGHAVRACYQYAAMAELDSVMGASEYSTALDKIWHNIVDTKMHITGGLGAVHGIEGFGPEYLLPNAEAYNETCAAVGNVFFNYRMFLKYRDAKYIDVAEVSLLNNSLSGVSMDGKSFFYPNPLEVIDHYKKRAGWFGCACCPSNIARLIPQVSGYMYAHTDSDIYCTLYGASETTVKLKGTDVTIKQKTAYPFGETINFEVAPEKAADFTMHVRIPTWAGTQFVPGKLYSYLNASKPWSLKVNGKPVTPKVEKGFAVIKRTWKAGDKVTLTLPLETKLNSCIEQVVANINRVSVTRGPLVYCAEGVDNAGPVQRFFLDQNSLDGTAKIATVNEGLLKGVSAVTIPVKELTKDGVENATMTLVPYYTWSNRGMGTMNVWFGKDKSLAHVSKGGLKFTKVSASHTFGKDSVDALKKHFDPKNSFDTSIPRWTSWPEKGKTQWLEFDLGKKKTVKRVGMYWYDDKGGVQVPKSWHIEAKNKKGKWDKVEIYNTDQYSCIKDSYNAVQPDGGLTARTFRIVMEPQHGNTCVGVLSVNIEAE